MTRAIFVTLMCMCMLISIRQIHAQDITNFFDSTDKYSGFQIQDVKRSINGDMKSFTFGLWDYYDITRKSNTGSLFTNVELSNIVSSNTISLTTTHKERGTLSINGGEIQVVTPIYLSTLGYNLYTINTDVDSEYFLLAYVSDSNDTSYDLVYSWRVLIFFNPKLELEGEIVGDAGSYFIRSEYRYLKKRSNSLQDAFSPSIFTLETREQNIIAVINVYSRKALWQEEDLSFSDQTAVGIFVGVLNSMRFTIGKSGMLKRKKHYIDRKNAKNDKEFLFDIEDIMLPDELGE